MKLSLPRLSLALLAIVALVLPQMSSPAMDIIERVVTTQTGFIRYEATEYQRKVALANAHAYMAAHKPKSASKTAKTSKTEKTEKTASTTPKPKTKEKEMAQEKQPEKTKLPRYVAIDTVKDKRAAPGTQKVVMIWDTQSEALVNNSVYDVQTVPAVGSTAKFDTFSAQYVGNGQ